jgi:hypothetical protein
MNSESTRAWNMISGIMEMVSLESLLLSAESDIQSAQACQDILAVIEAHHERGLA